MDNECYIRLRNLQVNHLPCEVKHVLHTVLYVYWKILFDNFTKTVDSVMKYLTKSKCTNKLSVDLFNLAKVD